MKETNNHMLQVGTVLHEKWVILEFIGKGGMGEVYRAHQLNLKRDVAVKVVSREWLESLGGEEEEIETGLQRFRREAEAMAQITHPNILRVYDHGSASVSNGVKEFAVEYIAMEYVPGGTLRSAMSKDGFYPEEALTREWIRDFFLPVLDGVMAIHKAGVIHRDLKPENILMDGKTPRIADFGLSRSSGSRPLTQSVHVMGSPVYMSPEHFLDFRRADERADIYSLGKILYEAIEGKSSPKVIPFKKAGLRKATTSFFQKLDQIIQDATAEDREKRLPTVEKFRSLLVELLDDSEQNQIVLPSAASGKPTMFPHWKWILPTVVAVILFVAALTVSKFNYLKLEQTEHQGARQMLTEPRNPDRTEQSLGSPSSRETNPLPPSEPGYQEKNSYGYDNCEVTPYQNR